MLASQSYWRVLRFAGDAAAAADAWHGSTSEAKEELTAAHLRQLSIIIISLISVVVVVTAATSITHKFSSTYSLALANAAWNIS